MSNNALHQSPVAGALRLVSQNPGAAAWHQPMPAENGWTIACRVALPDDEVYEPHPSVFDAMLHALDGRAPIYRVSPGLLSIHFNVEAPDMPAGQVAALPLIDAILALFMLKRSAVLSVAIASHRDIAADIDELPDCVGLHEAATLLGVTKQRIHQLAQAGGFPTPVMRLRSGPIWRSQDIKLFNATRRKRPGRPKGS